MEKLRESLLAKLVAGILLPVFLLLALVSGIEAIVIYEVCGYIPENKEDTRRKVITQIAETEYGDIIENYYTAVLNDSKNDILYYENLLSSDNCNLAFTATAEDDSQIVLSNFELSNPQYHLTTERYISYDYDTNELKIKESIDDILLNLAEINKGDIIVWSEDGTKVKVYT